MLPRSTFVKEVDDEGDASNGIRRFIHLFVFADLSGSPSGHAADKRRRGEMKPVYFGTGV